MLQQSSSCCDSLFASPDFEFRPCLASPKTKTAFSCSMEKHKLLFTSASSSLSLKQQFQTKRNPVLACRASRDPQLTSGRDDAAVHGVADVIVGVLGGGQLGRMLCQAASQMAIKVMVLDPQENCPASEIAHHHMVGSFDDSATVQEFAKRCGVLTVEIEHVDVETLEKLEQQGVDCQPKASTIRIIQDKYLQKVHFSKHDIPLPEFMQIDDLEGAKRAGDLFGYPLMIKSKRLAYDGRGNAVAKSEDELSSAVTALGGFDRGLYVEKWAPFVKELAVIVARGRDNSIACYPVVETIHKENICHIVKAPANMSWKIRKLATDIASRAVRSLEGAGVFAVELFLTKDDQGEPGFLLAQQLIGRALRIPGATVHWYDKPEMRKQRKMGHITIVGPSLGNVEKLLESMLNEERFDSQSAVTPRVGIIMGSDSDLPVMKDAAKILNMFGVPNEVRIVSAHRTPELMYSYALSARERGIQVIIAGAGMVAALTPLPVIGVPVRASTLDGIDSLLSIVQMPRGVPVATVAVNNATNAGLLAVRILGVCDADLVSRMTQYQEDTRDEVLTKAEKLQRDGWESYLNP
ncbi:hypothetical protein C1H46_021408 [Malus baccata]|uniref:phosphoribosylaminoimidazole carboxylase n=1 Tax=Malus baccata TaxID=106549 RepID=A0A540M2J7_MALBA|nr:hypothetical protein C1H46_021408 [Malus baccata]